MTTRISSFAGIILSSAITDIRRRAARAQDELAALAQDHQADSEDRESMRLARSLLTKILEVK